MELNIGLRIRQCRKAKNMTQQELADLLQISVHTLANYENNRTIPGLSFMSALADVLHTTMDDLILHDAQKNKDR